MALSMRLSDPSDPSDPPMRPSDLRGRLCPCGTWMIRRVRINPTFRFGFLQLASTRLPGRHRPDFLVGIDPPGRSASGLWLNSTPQVRHVEVAQPKRTRELPQLVEPKSLGENVGNLPIRRNMLQFHFTGENTLLDEMVMHLDVLRPCVKDRVFRELNAAKVVAMDCRRFRHLLMQLLEQALNPDGFTCRDSRASIFRFRARQCYYRLLLTAPRDRGTPDGEHVSGRGSAIGGIASPIGIGVTG
jgi:hypothetical protein